MRGDLSGSSLAVGKDGSIESFKHVRNDRLCDALVDLVLGSLRVKHIVVQKLSLFPAYQGEGQLPQ